MPSAGLKASRCARICLRDVPCTFLIMNLKPLIDGDHMKCLLKSTMVDNGASFFLSKALTLTGLAAKGYTAPDPVS